MTKFNKALSNKKESKEFSLFGDLDGMTVAEIREWLDQFHEDARLDARTEYDESEIFVFLSEE